MALMLDAGPGDSIRIGANTIVRIERKTGQRTRLRIDSSEDIALHEAGGDPPSLDKPQRRTEKPAAPAQVAPEQEPRAVLRRGP